MEDKYARLLEDAKRAYDQGIVPIESKFFWHDEEDGADCACAFGAAYIACRGTAEVPLPGHAHDAILEFAEARYELTAEECEAFMWGFDGDGGQDLSGAEADAFEAGQKARKLFLQ